MSRFLSLTALSIVALVVLSGCNSVSSAPTVVTVRLWDQQVADAYDDSFAQFEKENPDIDVQTIVVPWTEYFSTLRLDAAAGRSNDIFWVNATNIEDLARSGAIRPIDEVFDRPPSDTWSPFVVEQYTANGHLWGVPQLVDLGIGLLYNRDLTDAAGIDEKTLEALAWHPTATSDTLRETAIALTEDVDGRHPDEADYDATRVAHYGYSASNDLNASLLSMLGSNGALWQDGERFAFDSPAGVQAVQYLVDLIQTLRVAPRATDTNPPTGVDTNLRLFLEGRLALFQTGSYHLAAVKEGAAFPWGIVRIPAGVAGAVTPTNGIVAAAAADSAHPDAQRRVLAWLGSSRGSRAIGATGAALPAVIDAQAAYYSFWEAQNIDITPMIDVLENTIDPPTGARYSAAQDAYEPIFNRIFTGTTPVAEGLKSAEDAANAALAQ